MACCQPAGPEGRHGWCQKRALELQQAGDARPRSGRTSRACDTDTGMRQQQRLLLPGLAPRALLAAFPASGLPPVPSSQGAAAPASHRSLRWVLQQYGSCASWNSLLAGAFCGHFSRQTFWSAVIFTLPPVLLSAEAFLESLSFAQLPVLIKLAPNLILLRASVGRNQKKKRSEVLGWMYIKHTSACCQKSILNKHRGCLLFPAVSSGSKPDCSPYKPYSLKHKNCSHPSRHNVISHASSP